MLMMWTVCALGRNSDSVAFVSIRMCRISCILQQDEFSRQLDGVDWFEWRVWSRELVKQEAYQCALHHGCAPIVQVEYKERKWCFVVFLSAFLPNRFPWNSLLIDDELYVKRPIVFIGAFGAAWDGCKTVRHSAGGNGHRTLSWACGPTRSID